MTEPPAPESDLPEQMRVRRDKRTRLLREGHEPYPVGVPRTHTLTGVRAAYGHLSIGEETQDVVGCAEPLADVLGPPERPVPGDECIAQGADVVEAC